MRKIILLQADRIDYPDGAFSGDVNLIPVVIFILIIWWIWRKGKNAR